MAKLGAHLVFGPRIGYGDFVRAQPAVVLGVGQGGALTEAWRESGGHTYTIYRDTELYLDAPAGMDHNDEAWAISEAERIYPWFEGKWKQNLADYYVVLNEPAGNDLGVLPTYLAYEKRMMELAEANGRRLCVLNLAGGTPGDFEVWKEHYVPHIERAFVGKHIYGRHAYGDLFAVTSGNLRRPVDEAEYLRQVGLGYGGMVITELGLNGGEGYVGDDAFFKWATDYEWVMMRPEPNIIGGCLWTLGDWKGANWDSAIDELVPWMEQNFTSKWLALPPEPPQSEPRILKHTIHLLPQNTNQDELSAVSTHLHETRSAFTYSHDVVEATMFYSTKEGKIVIWDGPRWNMDLHKKFAWLGVNIQDRSFSELMDQPFKFWAWPTTTVEITQPFGANHDYYWNNFGLPGHEGVDMAAPKGSPVFAVADGTVYEVRNDDNHNWGNRIRIIHKGGFRTIYAHLLETGVHEGQEVEAGKQIGLADNTGNILSGSSHLHLTLKHEDAAEGGPMYIGFPYEIIDPTPYLLPFLPDQPAPSAIDLLPFFVTPEPLGPLYEVQTRIWNSGIGGWESGPQQRHQTQRGSDVTGLVFHTKGGDGPSNPSEYEQLLVDGDFIYRGIDTSPGNDQYYLLQDFPGQPWSKWIKRYMSVGERFLREALVFFFRKSDCTMISQGVQQSWILFEAFHQEITFFTGQTMTNVIRLAWLDMQDNVIERYLYSEGYGLIGWSGAGKESAISEKHAPGSRPDNVREVIECM